MKRLLKISLLVAYVSICYSCASGQLQLNSEPAAAEVFLTSAIGKTSLGKTPLTLNANDLNRVNGPIIHLEVSKKGFLSRNLVVSKNVSQKQATIDLKLSPTDEWLKQQDEYKACAQVSGKASQFIAEIATNSVCPTIGKEKFNKLANGIAEAQALILRKDYLAAQIRLKTLTSDYPHVSVIYDLLGNISFIQRNLSDALRNYLKSLSIEPTNTQTQTMIRKIRQISPGLPTGREGP